MAVELTVPALGESITEAVVGKWHKKVGDSVAVDEPVVVLETDKVTIDVPAPAAGTLSAIAHKEGDTVKIGDVLGSIGAASASAGAPAAAKPAPAAAPSAPAPTSAAAVAPARPPPVPAAQAAPSADASRQAPMTP
ncbi:MAG: biotin/lipoyl-containing protein, partial [Myxococcaceae bacterium]